MNKIENKDVQYHCDMILSNDAILGTVGREPDIRNETSANFSIIETDDNHINVRWHNVVVRHKSIVRFIRKFVKKDDLVKITFQDAEGNATSPKLVVSKSQDGGQRERRSIELGTHFQTWYKDI